MRRTRHELTKLGTVDWWKGPGKEKKGRTKGQPNLRIKGEELASSLSDLREGELHAPDFSLAPEAVLAEELELLVETLLLVRAAGGLRGLRVVALGGDGRHGEKGGVTRLEGARGR